MYLLVLLLSCWVSPNTPVLDMRPVIEVYELQPCQSVFTLLPDHHEYLSELLSLFEPWVPNDHPGDFVVRVFGNQYDEPEWMLTVFRPHRGRPFVELVQAERTIHANPEDGDATLPDVVRWKRYITPELTTALDQIVRESFAMTRYPEHQFEPAKSSCFWREQFTFIRGHSCGFVSCRSWDSSVDRLVKLAYSLKNYTKLEDVDEKVVEEQISKFNALREVLDVSHLLVGEWQYVGEINQTEAVECPDFIEFSGREYTVYNDCYADDRSDPIVETGGWHIAEDKLVFTDRQYLASYIFTEDKKSPLSVSITQIAESEVRLLFLAEGAAVVKYKKVER